MTWEVNLTALIDTDTVTVTCTVTALQVSSS